MFFIRALLEKSGDERSKNMEEKIDAYILQAREENEKLIAKLNEDVPQDLTEDVED